MSPPLGVYTGNRTYVRVVDPEQEKLLGRLLLFLEHNKMAFYSVIEHNEGSQRYVEVSISIKLT